ncbi:protein kinase/lanthionine synthetase C family protein [Lysobacter sp. SG-8]|uniref:Protein kinase/lanthionine synthetase C family protein n=1 Tax=Marilutibacter penaei TaxID=2759900 RepID=A0A7W3YER8_9GAMM|nr:lanthionine synthetase LanC family protein [Lysobacter penaei]MBB1088728.1 protein kinase/lanthionine synthetase C family protein [Lysobacter penaei]
MNSVPYLIYSFLDPEFYENIDQYDAGDEYERIVRSLKTDTWSVTRRGFWTNCFPDDWNGASHGWKIHVSSTSENAEQTLRLACKVLVEAGVGFKFCADQAMLGMSLSKSWSRFQSGKFIAAYPRDEVEFKYLAQKLAEATAHLNGPHVLTDRAVPGSNVVYYRYGAFTDVSRVDCYGVHTSGFRRDDGEWQEDIRDARFRLPPGIIDPFSVSAEPSRSNSGNPDDQAPVVLVGRYKVEGALKFNASGGIYAGRDLVTGQEIVLREVRETLGHLENENPEDPAHVLKREARIIQKLSSTGYVPEYVDIFKCWKSWFLVVERIDAISLWGHSMEFFYSEEFQSSALSTDKIVETAIDIGRGLQEVHTRNVVLRDLTRNNVMFAKDKDRVKFIDLEFAYDLDSDDQWINGWTPGYGSSDQTASQRPAKTDDYYAFGVLILDMLTFCAAGLELNRLAIFAKLRLVLEDMGLPAGLYDIVTGLMDEDRATRWNIEKAMAELQLLAVPRAEQHVLPSRSRLLAIEHPSESLLASVTSAERGVARYLEAKVCFARSDRLWPVSPEGFSTNPISIQYGASGIAWYLLRRSGTLDTRIIDWIEARLGEHDCPPGLYSGLSGVSLLLLYSGREQTARKILAVAEESPLLSTNSSLYFGAAGMGMAYLHFWKTTGDSKFLHLAENVGSRLLASAASNDRGLSWPTAKATYLGLGDGQCGIAIFLLSLFKATGQEVFLATAKKAIEFDCSYGVLVAGRTVWKTHTEAREGSPNLPHMRFGSAGVGSACIRYFAETGDRRFLDHAEECAHAIRPRISNKIWQDEGSSGYGEFLLDMHHFTGDSRYRDLAFHHAEAILVHGLTRPEGMAFGGVDHYKICSDYASGSAGIGMFLHRLVKGGNRFLLLDDELLATPAVAQPLDADIRALA